MTVNAEHPGSLSETQVDGLVRDLLADQGYPDRVEVAVHLVSRDEIAIRNAEAFGKPGATDVVSFPVEDLEPDVAPTVDDAGPPLLLGDVFISPEVVAERAADHGSTARDHEALMVVHGLLHLIGHDHLADADAAAMEAIEARVLASNGFGRR